VSIFRMSSEEESLGSAERDRGRNERRLTFAYFGLGGVR
jgi:hypothetical protein